MNQAVSLRIVCVVALCLAVGSNGNALGAQTTQFTYQGKLADTGAPANGNYDFQFKLFDTGTVGTGAQKGAVAPVSNVTVTNGIFTVQLDFGACSTCFDGSARFLEIAVKPTSGSTFTTLGPRQPVSSTPYAMRSLNSATADGLSLACINCVTNSQIQSIQGSKVTGNISGNQISGAIPVASVPVGSASYIQNQNASEQAASNFNISGDGAAGGTLSGQFVNATAQYNIGGSSVLSIAGSNNLFAGVGAGGSNIGGANAFFGASAGSANTTGDTNAFFGASAGSANTTGSSNSFFGQNAGRKNTIGQNNSFIGWAAGFQAGGSKNTFVGAATDFSSFGSPAAGDNNTLLGYGALLTPDIDNSTAIGANASVTQSNSLVLGGINGVNGATADTKVGIGTTSPTAKLTVSGAGAFSVAGAARIDLFNATANVAFSQHVLDDGRWQLATTAGNQTRLLVDTAGNVGIGANVPADKLQVAGDIRVGTGTNGCVKDANGTIIAGTCSSDARLKKDITPFPRLLDKLVQLQPVHFYWRTDQFPDRHFGSSQSFGLVAQDVEKVMPELVDGDESGYKVVRYSKLPLLMLQAIRELKSENDELKQKLHTANQQRERIEQQQAVIEALKKLVCLDHAGADLCK